MSDAEWVTVHVGTPWELDLFCGMLDDEGIPWQRPDDVVGAADSLLDPTGATSRRLQVRTEDEDRTRALIASHHGEVEDTEDDEYELTGQEEVELIARSARRASWSLVGIVLVPWLMVLYRRACREYDTESKHHALTVAAPWIGAGGIVLVVLAFRFVPGWLPERSPERGLPPVPPPPPPTRGPIVPG